MLLGCRIGASLFAAALTLLPLAPASAAQFDVETKTGNDGRPITFISLSGEMLTGDASEFDRLTRQAVGHTVVFLESPGGDLQAGIAIGRAIRKGGHSTAAPKICASACALAWLAGSTRYATPQSEIGFHVAYTGLEQRESGMGNAVVGLYLGELGLGENVVRYVTSAAPDSMQWLSMRDAELLGIDLVSLDGSPATEDVASAPSLPAQSSTPAREDDLVLGLDPANVLRAAKNAAKRYQDAGMAGLVASSVACWEVVRDKRLLDRVQYCRTLDMVGMALDAAAVKNFGQQAALPHFDAKARLSDLVDGLWACGVEDADIAVRLDGVWQGQFQDALAQL